MAYYKNLREYLAALDKAGKLITINAPINKDTQLVPIVYLQWRGLPKHQQKGFLFTNVIDSRGKKYEFSVGHAVIRPHFDIGLQCRRDEVEEKVAQAIMHPLEPVLVKQAPVQEVVHMGNGLLEHGGLDEIPVTNTHPGWDGGPIMGASCWVSKDPETGKSNTGGYRCDIYSPTMVGIHIGGVNQDLSSHWQKCRALGIPLQAAVVVGGPPNLTYAAYSKFPYGVNEYSITGAMVGEPVEMVKCKTVDLEVPARADFVIEGEISTSERMIEGPHGEAPGLVSMGDLQPFLTVKCITHRKDAIFISPGGGPPGQGYKRFKYDLKMPFVLATGTPYTKAPSYEGHDGAKITAIKIKNGTPQEDVWRALEAASGGGGIVVAVDEHIDVENIDMVLWAIAHKSQPHRDTRISQRIDMHPLESVYMPEALSQAMRRNQFHPDQGMPGDTGVPGGSCLMINATQKWPYPPLNLPKKEFMEGALAIWKELNLPPLDLNETWYGYELGDWPKEFAEDAEAATKGEYYQTYERRFKQRVSNSDLPPGDYWQMRDRWLNYPHPQVKK